MRLSLLIVSALVLLGSAAGCKKKGEVAEVATPRGTVAWTIEDVSY